jgi:hypothetical protein
MFAEAVKVVPIHPGQDRYLPYRNAFNRAQRYAYIYDHHRSEESRATFEAHVGAQPVEQFSVGDFDVYIQRRAINNE